MELFCIKYKKPGSNNIWRTECLSELERAEKKVELLKTDCAILEEFEDEI